MYMGKVELKLLVRYQKLCSFWGLYPHLHFGELNYLCAWIL